VLLELGRGSLADTVALLDEGDDLGRAALLCGAGFALLDLGIAYAKERHVFGKPLIGFQVQRHAFALVSAKVEAATALVRRVAAAEKPDALDTASVLPVASDAAWASAEQALQIHGGNGYSDEYPVSRMWREVVAVRRTVEPISVPG
jgi:alkylation response protein AidB-like acyl-CoA dehydrogenase